MESLNTILDKIQNIEDKEVRTRVLNSIKELQAQMQSLQTTHPYIQEERDFYTRQEIKRAHKETILQDIQLCQTHNPKAEMEFIKQSLDKDSEDKGELRDFTLKKWEDLITHKKNAYIQAQTNRILQDFSHRIDCLERDAREAEKLSQELGEVFGDLKGEVLEDFDISNLGDAEYQKKLLKGRMGFDDSGVNPKNISFNAIKQYFAMIKNNPALKEICELLGKMRGKEKEEKKTIIKEMKRYESAQRIPTKNSKEEVSGVMLGRNLEELLPQELGLLNDETLEILFALKYIENQLFCFEKQGYSDVSKMYEVEEEVEKIEEEEKPKNEGAMIICVDSSGSMSGTPECIAKGITLFMAQKALKEKRSCYLINFSTSVRCVDMSSLKGMRGLFEFLQLSFGGGTDVGVALKAGVRKMGEDDFKKSDLLVVSDGDFGEVSGEILKQMQKQREAENRFYLLDINGNSGAKKIFDKHWEYDSRSQNLKELYAMSKEFDRM